MTHEFGSLAPVVISIVGAVCVMLVIIGIGAWRRTGENRLLWLVAAFSLFAVKSFLNAWALTTGAIQHEHLELVSSLFDLAIVACIVAPLLRRH
jgi:hypothetical protein